ncbi:unnamed protein product [Allacma fusca]|uniref:Glycoprotein n=1 Tax=Allacma fusca TaxID=39272 RepID=A0A8J2JXM9_9HEXA|nr:unnamed protein product [Allacma fusca]
MFLKFLEVTFFIVSPVSNTDNFQSCFGIDSIQNTISVYTPIYVLKPGNTTTINFRLLVGCENAPAVLDRTDQSEALCHQNGECHIKDGNCLTNLQKIYETWIGKGKLVQWILHTDAYPEFLCLELESLRIQSTLAVKGISVLCDGINASFNEFDHPRGSFPRFRVSSTATDGVIYDTGFIRRFNFITTDGVWQANAGLGVYYAPFRWQIWASKAIVALAMIIYLNYIQGLRSWTRACFYALCPLVEQGGGVYGKTRIANCLVATCGAMTIRPNTFPPERIRYCSKGYYKNDPFIFFDASVVFLHRKINETHFRSNQFHCTCNQDLKNLTVTELTKPMTAVVTLSTDLNIVWRILEEQMHLNHSLKFAHNGGILDSMFSSRVYYKLQNDWISEKYNIFQNRLEHLLAGELPTWTSDNEQVPEILEVTSEPVLPTQSPYLNGILIGVTVVSGIIFVLVATLLLYVVIHAKSSPKPPTDNAEEDEVFDEAMMIAAWKKRSIIRFDIESDNEEGHSA